MNETRSAWTAKVTRAGVYDNPWPKVKAGVGSRLLTRRLPHRKEDANVGGRSLRVLTQGIRATRHRDPNHRRVGSRLVATPSSPMPALWRSLGCDEALFLADPTLAAVTVCIFKVWVSFPFMMLMTSAALASVDDTIYEAANMDGVQDFQTGPGVAITPLMTLVLVIISTVLYRQIRKGKRHWKPLGSPPSSPSKVRSGDEAGMRGRSWRMALIAVITAVVLIPIYVPHTLEEAAWLDGYSVFGSFTKIVFRNSLPGIRSPPSLELLPAERHRLGRGRGRLSDHDAASGAYVRPA